MWVIRLPRVSLLPYFSRHFVNSRNDVPRSLGSVHIRLLLTDPLQESSPSNNADASSKKSKLLKKLDRLEEKERQREERDKIKEEKEKLKEEKKRNSSSLSKLPPHNTSMPPSWSRPCNWSIFAYSFPAEHSNNIDLTPYLNIDPVLALVHILQSLLGDSNLFL